MTKRFTPPTVHPGEFDEADYLTTMEVSKIHKRDPRTIQYQCAQGKIPGVIRVEGGPFRPYFLIPKTSLRFVCTTPRGRPKKQRQFPGSVNQVAPRGADGAPADPPNAIETPEFPHRE
jgi:hypothetical protein